MFDAALELGPSRINRAYPAGHDSGGPRLITEPFAEAAAGSDREQRGVTLPPSMLVPNEDAGGDCDPLSQRGRVADVSQMDLGAHAHRRQGDEPHPAYDAQMSGAREAWEAERDNWLEFGDRLRSILGLGAGRGGGAVQAPCVYVCVCVCMCVYVYFSLSLPPSPPPLSMYTYIHIHTCVRTYVHTYAHTQCAGQGLIKVVQKELTARDKKIEMLQQTVARLESDSKHANEATQVLEAVRTRAFGCAPSQLLFARHVHAHIHTGPATRIVTMCHLWACAGFSCVCGRIRSMLWSAASFGWAWSQ